jgi:hypothetical protein
LQAQDPLVFRFIQLRESGVSKEEAWKLMAVEILAEAGLVAPEHMEVAPVARQAVYSQFPIDEAKLVRVVRVEPEEDDRIKILLARAKSEANVSNKDPPKMSSIVRQALRLGLDELERQRYRK